MSLLVSDNKYSATIDTGWKKDCELIIGTKMGVRAMGIRSKVAILTEKLTREFVSFNWWANLANIVVDVTMNRNSDWSVHSLWTSKRRVSGQVSAFKGAGSETSASMAALWIMTWAELFPSTK
jgi:hypothetical protein